MTKYTIYDPATNNIKMIFEGSESDALLNGSIIEGEYSSDEYNIIDGQPVRKSQTDIEEVIDDYAWNELRKRRNGYLSDSDWTQTLDTPLSETKKAEWATYRQTLRDLPSNTTDPSNPNFPDKPS
tara:strand:+ start:11342 stop:11716 length:375 start_codon:yes stop_codon:yes gene_type:complete